METPPPPTTSPNNANTPPSLLVVLAHPDDESLACGGLLAWCAAIGIRVSLLCLTHGEYGQTNDRKLQRQSVVLRDVRVAELDKATRILGIANVIIGDHEDGMLPWIDAALIESDIRQAINQLHPHVVITFGADGLYWHPDHIAVHERTTSVIASLGDKAPALFYVTIPSGSMRAVVDHAAKICTDRSLRTPAPRSILGVNDADAFGAKAAAPTLVVRTGKFSVQKLRALACHYSQYRDCALTLVSTEDAPKLLGTEHYHRAAVGAMGPSFLEQFG